MVSRDTRERVQSGFLQLIVDKPYSRITMTSLAAELGMSRQNLYRYYSSKDQILADTLEETLHPLLKMAEEVDVSKPPDEQWNRLMDRTFRLVDNHRTIMMAVLKSGEDELLYKVLKSFVVRALGSFIRASGMTIHDHEYFDAITSHLSGGFFYLFKSWGEGGMTISVEKIARIQKTYSLEVLKELVQSCN